jgi:hypothetical protein
MVKKSKVLNTAFLSEWLREYKVEKSKFESTLVGLSAEKLEEVAVTNGFRTWRLHRAFIDHHGLLLQRFVGEEAFAILWQALADYDEKHESFAFSPGNGGVPATILRRLDAWYRTPKFTPIQLRAHYEKITAGCEELLHLLRQVTPGQQGNRQFAAFNFLEPGQARYLLRCFQSPAEVGRRKLSNGMDDSSYTKYFVAHVLEKAEITPIAALESIKREALSGPHGSKLPTKLAATGAMRTYFIHATFDAVNNATSTFFHNNSIAGNQLLADLVGLISDTDCHADDVRKALKNAPED